MKKLVPWASLALLITFLMPLGVIAENAQSRTPHIRVSVDVLSDTGGANLQPYLNALAAAMRSQWETRATALPAAHDADRRETLLDLTLAKDGRLLALQQRGGERDEVWSKVAWDSAKNNVFQALPFSFQGTDLKIRLHFSTQ